ncbi:VOC family protein [Curtobacterium sp. MCPF17_047]|uniref:VOC family protein n=2 Tax=unclassified Curtobacterium TaxID=257496 RepID=UPI0021ACAB9F|nr:VOC family protein [Curtobacterium sp. MCPF17_047]
MRTDQDTTTVLDMSVTGIGGLFFRSRDPEARAAWYRKYLGVDAGADTVWHQDAGMTVFAPFRADDEYFALDQPFMINLRVEALDELVARLEAAGVAVERRPEWETEYGLRPRPRSGGSAAGAVGTEVARESRRAVISGGSGSS